jgi:regulator of sirC expression with transglutaminase-like and TPR domain
MRAEESPALETFRAEIRRLRVPGGLLRAAAAVALHEMPDVDLDDVEARVGALAEEVRSRTSSERPTSLLAHLHQVLFEEHGFRGNADEYDDPRNSYMHWVLETRRGLPITLALLYRGVAERLGLAVTGLNTPGHFLVEVEGEGEPMIVDPFAAGRVLSRAEAIARIEQATGLSVVRAEGPLPVATPKAWLFRILQNLVLLFIRRDRETDAQVMVAMQDTLRSA